MPAATADAAPPRRPREIGATTRCQWIAVTMIILMITCGGIALLNCVLLAFEAYLDYSVKMAAIAATTITITTITTTATTITIAATTTAA
ncbi:hypothetical protein A0O28_0084590 [Trichoderma guizhouense]|uniref:Uncharacterized protein n=1 Tax=Trichoderma guizhouense TaxID=1491466 RepID=A0A1T3CP16_9HYPO|nr:hypothetical protein A0O28_0084590 [Trichoderma guizhouense]